MADTQKSSSSCLPLSGAPDSFLQRPDGRQHLQFQYTPEDASRNIRAYISTLLGALRCLKDVQLADGRGMLLKYVSSYVTKMHEAATVEGLYCTDVTGYQAANSFLRSVHPLAPEMAFQLSNIKVAWTDKLTKQFRVPHPGQEDGNLAYQLFRHRDPSKEGQSLLQWLRSHSTAGRKAKTLAADKYLVAIKLVSAFNPVFFYQHLLVHHPHRHPAQLLHLERATMPPAIQYFAQALALSPQSWSTPEQIRQQFDHEGHRTSFLTTLVSYVMALHAIHDPWQCRIVDACIGCLQARLVERLYPLSPLQRALFRDIVESLARHQAFLDQAAQPGHSASSADPCWRKYRVLLGEPDTGKSQVLIRVIHDALWREAKVLLAAPVALLAQGYRSIFGTELECNTLHAWFRIPVQEGQSSDVNFSLNRFDMVVVDEASLVSPASFNIVAGTLNRLNCRPVVVIAGDRKQQQPLQTVQGRVSNTVSIINDQTFTQDNAVKHSLHQQFRILDKDYEAFVKMVRHLQPTQAQLDQFQEGLVLCPSGFVSDEELYQAFNRQSQTSVMTVSRAAAQRINRIVVQQLFAGKEPLSDVACAAVSGGPPILPYAGMKIVINENRDKASRIVNGQDATLVSAQANTIILRFPDGDQAFVYLLTHHVKGEGDVTRYPFSSAYARTISKSQGQNLKHLLVWLDCPVVPARLAYVALS